MATAKDYTYFELLVVFPPGKERNRKKAKSFYEIFERVEEYLRERVQIYSGRGPQDPLPRNSFLANRQIFYFWATPRERKNIRAYLTRLRRERKIIRYEFLREGE